MDEVFRGRSIPVELSLLIWKPVVWTMGSLFGNKMGEYKHFCVVIMDTDLLKEVQKGKEKRNSKKPHPGLHY